MKCGEFHCPAFHYTHIICNRIIRLSAPHISLIVYPINRTIIPCIFWHFHFLHETLCRLYIHLCLFQRAYPVLRRDFLPYFRNLCSLFRLHIPKSSQLVIGSLSVIILIYRNYFPFGSLPRGNLRERDKPVILGAMSST